jgi:hypothetical protein
MAEHQVLGDAVFVCLVHEGARAQTAAAFRAFGLAQMASAGLFAENLARGSDLKPLGRRLFRFDTFGSSHKSNRSEK